MSRESYKVTTPVQGKAKAQRRPEKTLSTETEYNNLKTRNEKEKIANTGGGDDLISKVNPLDSNTHFSTTKPIH